MALPIPLSALQRYVPALFLLLLITYEFPVNRTSLSLPSNTLVQLTVGVGLPSAEQLKVIVAGSFSTTTRSGLKPLKLGGTVQDRKRNSMRLKIIDDYQVGNVMR